MVSLSIAAASSPLSPLPAHAIDLALLVFRVAVGGVFVAHGANHIFGGGKIAGTGRWFESLGMKPGWLHAWTASLTELGAGAMLVAGLAVPLAGAGVIGVMLVAWITNHRKNGFFIFRPGEGWEYVMILTVCGLTLALLGGGCWSVDRLFHWQRLAGWNGLIIAAVGGVGGALALLVGFWRPQRPTAPEGE